MAKGKHRTRKPFEESTAQTTSKFLLLPGEIRTAIYRAALVKPDAIDLWPSKWITNIEQFDDLVARLDKKKATGYAIRDQHALRYVRQELAVGLLGTCRQVRMEANRIFWCENQFRFSADFEWIGLRRFLTTIGPGARSLITKLEVAPPHIICLVNQLDDMSSFYDKPKGKNHPKLKMAKLYTERKNTHWRRHCYDVSTNDNFQFVSHMLHEERTLQQLHMVVPSGWKIRTVFDILPGDFDRLRWLDMKIVVQIDARVDDEYAKARFEEMELPVSLMPGSMFASQQQIPVNHWQHTIQRVLEQVVNQTEWLLPSEDNDEPLTYMDIMFDEELCDDAVRPAMRAGKLDPRLWRVLHGFGGCRFVHRRGTYCLDCNQLIEWSVYSSKHWHDTGSSCIRCNGKGGTRWIDTIEVRKLKREEKKNAAIRAARKTEEDDW